MVSEEAPGTPVTEVKYPVGLGNRRGVHHHELEGQDGYRDGCGKGHRGRLCPRVRCSRSSCRSRRCQRRSVPFDGIGDRILDRGGTLGVSTDVANPVQCEALVASCVDRFGQCDVLLNNAGIIQAGSILDVSIEDFDRVLSVNLRERSCSAGWWRVTWWRRESRAPPSTCLPRTRWWPFPTNSPTAVSKGGVRQLTNAMAMALAPYDIRVNAIGPGSIQTDMLAQVMQDDESRRVTLSRTPLGRAGAPEEVAKVAVFLASDYASYMTGQTIYPDGGRLGLNYTVPLREQL